MDAESRYAVLQALADDSFDVERSEGMLADRFRKEVIAPFITPRGETFWLRRHRETGFVAPKVYRVFSNHPEAMAGDTALASFRLRGPVCGRATVERAEVDEGFRRRGIATEVYGIIAADIGTVGAELWPSPPTSMSDAGFLFWWQCRPDLVAYYPHRARLGVPLSLDEHQTLCSFDDFDRHVARLRFTNAAKSLHPGNALAAAGSWLRTKLGR